MLPLILPYLVSGYAFAFVLSLNEYIVAYMTVGFTMETLPIKIFNALRYGYTPTMASVTIFFVAIAALVFGLIASFGDIRRLLGAMSSEAQVMRLAALQMQATPGDVAANLARIERGRASVRPQPVRRCWWRRSWRVTGYGAGDAIDELAEPAEGAAVAALAELAARRRAWRSSPALPSVTAGRSTTAPSSPTAGAARPSTANRISTATMSAPASPPSPPQATLFESSRPEARHADLLRRRVPRERAPPGAGRRRRGRWCRPPCRPGRTPPSLPAA